MSCLTDLIIMLVLEFVVKSYFSKNFKSLLELDCSTDLDKRSDTPGIILGLLQNYVWINIEL